ncbi:MAG: hypothetical protein AAGJ67_01835 [Pseudomonadota bacterium]
MVRDNMRWLEGDTPPSSPPKALSAKERIAKQRAERLAQSEKDWQYIQANEQRYAQQRAETLANRNRVTQGLKTPQKLNDSFGLQCSLEEEMAKNRQHVLITDLDDAHKVLNNMWVERGKDAAVLAAHINTAKGHFNNVEPLFDAKTLAKEFGDVGIKADIVKSKGKEFIAFSGRKNGKALKHAFIQGTRIKMSPKKYPLDGLKAQQIGFSPKARAANFKGAGVVTFVVSASIASTNLYFDNDYHLVDWFGNVGSDMLKALTQFGAGELALVVGATLTGYVVVGFLAMAATYVAIDYLWGDFEVSNKIVQELEGAIE